MALLLKSRTQLTNSVADRACKPSGLSKVNVLKIRSVSGREWRNMIMVGVLGMLEYGFEPSKEPRNHAVRGAGLLHSEAAVPRARRVAAFS